MPEATFVSESNIVEIDYNTTPSVDEISEWSVRHHLGKRLRAYNILTDINPANEGWPDYETVEIPSLYLWLGTSEVDGVELGSDGSSYVASVYIFADNDTRRTRWAYLIKDIFRKTIPIYNYVTGNEVNPEPTGEYFISEDIGWNKIPHIYNAPDAERWRAVVTALLRRSE
jgi:hypothetical protein